MSITEKKEVTENAKRICDFFHCADGCSPGRMCRKGQYTGSGAFRDSGSARRGFEDEDLDVVIELADGVYTAEFETDSSMFHVSEACEGKGTLTVEKGNMTIHVSLASKNIVKLYCGLAEDAGKAADGLLLPTEDTVTYSDGLSEVVYGFDIPVPAIGEEFDLALIGKKGTWYDHKVRVTSPVPADSKP